MSPAERREYAQAMFADNPELFPLERRALILAGQVTLGMSPFEARLAGGAFTYQVRADTANWPPHSNPLDVMWRQSVVPDNSQIIMSFANNLQYPGEPDCAFKVYFDRGRAVRIQKMAGGA